MQPIRRTFPLLALLALLAGLLPTTVARAATLVVTTTAATGPGSLAAAIDAANAGGGGDVIQFSLPDAQAQPEGYWRIDVSSLTNGLPALTGSDIFIDGRSQPNAAGRTVNGPRVEVRGGAGGSGFTITSARNTIRGFILNGFSRSISCGGTLGACGAGLSLVGSAATNNLIYANYIGTDWSGLAAVPNNQAGLAVVNGASNNTIGIVGDGNVIAGNGGQDDRVQLLIGNTRLEPGENMSGNVVTGNFIGLAADGTTALTGPSHGVRLGFNAVSNTVGPGNYIAGNGATGSIRAYGIEISGTVDAGATQSNRVIGNTIGLNIAGNSVPNRNGGIRVQHPTTATQGANNIIGGPGAGDRNYIAGNNEYGIVIDGACRAAPAVTTVVQNNVIGLNAAGAGRGNSLAGILLSDRIDTPNPTDFGTCNNQIGPDNVISGNGQSGVQLDGVNTLNPTKANVIRGNLIGTGIDGNGNVPNGTNGVRLGANTSGNLVGGTTINDAAYRNLISGNTTFGVLIDSSPNNTVQGNVIINQASASGAGLVIQNAASTGNMIGGNAIGVGGGNTTGVRITGGANANTIGGYNDIGSNRRYGIEITGAGTNNNLILQNSVHDNGNFGSGGLAGVSITTGTGNRISQTATSNNGGANGKGINLNPGAAVGNGGRAAPTLSLGGGTLVGTSTCPNCVVEIFTGDAAEPSEGNLYLTSFNADGSGNFSVALPIAGCKPYLIATITDGAGNTSEFSNTVGPVASCVPAAPNIVLTKDTADVTNADAGTTYTYNHTLTNNGTGPGTYNVSLSSSQGWATLVPNTPSYTLASGQSVTIQVRVVVPSGATAGTSDASTITAVLVGGGSAAQTDVTTVKQRFDFSFTPPALSSNAPVPPGSSTTYNHTITNLGNGPDTFTFAVANNPASPAVSVVVSAPGCVNVAPGSSCNVAVTVTAPSNPPPSVVSTITATSKDGVTARSVVDTTQFKQVAVPVIAPASVSGSGKPGTSVQLVHTLTNVGQIAGTFTVDVPTDLGDGWTASVTQPSPSTFAPGDTRQFIVTVNIPAYNAGNPATYAGYVKTITVNVPASGENPAAVPANDSVTVLLAPAATITPPTRSAFAAPNQVIDFGHTLNNIGNGSETFDLTAQLPGMPPGWGVVFFDPATGQAITSLTVARGASQPFIARVSVPVGVVDAQSYNVGVRATARSDASAQANATETITIRPGAVPLLNGPLAGSVDPGVALTLNHTIQNVGNATGTFTYTFEALPSGWSATATQNPAGPLVFGAPAVPLTVQITPAPDALAGVYRVVVRARALDLNQATTSVVDTITVRQKADLRLAPNYDTLGDPGEVVIYTHTLTNAGNFTDTISLSISGTQPWAVNVLPTSVVLVARATTRVTVTVSVPFGIVAGTVNTATITAASSLPDVVAIVTDVTEVAPVPGLMLTPPLFVNAGEATKPVTFTYTLFNSGSVTQGYTLTATPPAGWNATVLSPTVQALTPGQIVQVRLVVIAPADTPNGTVGDTMLTAQSSVAPYPTATVTARLIVGPAYDVIIAPPRQAGVLPGRVYSYSHTVTNTGLFTDTYLLSTVSLLGWQTSIAPASLSLAPGATAQVTVTVAVPTSAQANVVETTRAYARSATRPTVNPYVDDTSTVLQVAGVQVSPRYSSFVEAGTTVTFLHQVTNIGNGGDSFTLSVTSSQGWPVTLELTQTPPLGAGVPFPVTLRATVPAGTPKDVVSNIVVRATSNFNGAVFSESVDTLGSPMTPLNVIIVPDANYKQYLPLVAR